MYTSMHVHKNLCEKITHEVSMFYRHDKYIYILYYSSYFFHTKSNHGSACLCIQTCWGAVVVA